MDIPTKQCNRCREFFPKETFYKYGNVRGLCTECEKIRKRINAAKAYKKNKEKYRDASVSQYRKNIDRYRELQRIRNRSYRLKVLEHYGAFCACCAESGIGFLTIDHINNDGYLERKSSMTSSTGGRITGGSWIYKKIINEKFPETFQILCYNCNCGKARNKGICPHKDTKNL